MTAGSLTFGNYLIFAQNHKPQTYIEMKVKEILAELEKKHPGEPEYHQAVKEVLESIEEVYNENPRFAKAGVLQRLIEPDRVFTFKVPWMDDKGNVQVNLGYRVQYNNAIGPYKAASASTLRLTSQSLSSLVLSRSSRTH